MRLVFDLETDGYLEHLTKVHCIAIRNADNPVSRGFTAHNGSSRASSS